MIVEFTVRVLETPLYNGLYSCYKISCFLLTSVIINWAVIRRKIHWKFNFYMRGIGSDTIFATTIINKILNVGLFEHISMFQLVFVLCYTNYKFINFLYWNDLGGKGFWWVISMTISSVVERKFLQIDADFCYKNLSVSSFFTVNFLH